LAGAHRPLLRPDRTTTFQAILGGIRGKKSLGGGTTKLQGGNHHGKKRGLRVYDGQRVPLGTLLAKQFRLDVLPGWNTAFGRQNDIVAKQPGRVMVTTERVNIDFDSTESPVRKWAADARRDSNFPADRFRDKNIFRKHVHIVPDEQHQYFKLVEQR